MTPRRRLDHGTLRRRVLVTGSAISLLILLGLGSFVAVNASLRTRLEAATDAYAEEQAIAADLTDAVMRQLLLVSAQGDRPAGQPGDSFQRSGDEAQALIQRYLFRNLTPAERLHLEAVKTEHQRLEVAASRWVALLDAGEAAAAEAAADAVTGRASELLDALQTFLGMRASALDELRARQNAAFQSFYLAGGGFAVLLLLGSLVLGRTLQRRVADPLTELARGARRIGEGDLDARVPVARDREFAEVAEAFNAMGEELLRARAELEGRNEQLADLLETVRQAQAELIEAEKLSAMGRMTAGLAHELNNPLATVLGYAELLGDRLASGDAPGPEALEESYLAPMMREAERASELVRNFTLFARGSEAGLGPVRVREALDVVVGLQAFAFEKAGVDLAVGDVPDVWVHAERQRLQEVFLNLVTNALDAMEGGDGARLRVKGRLEADRLLLSFEDEGPGVADLDRLFEPFYTTKAVGSGTGLGLALVHRAMEDFGGTVRVENMKGSGARFVLDLRAVDPPPASGEAPVETRPAEPAIARPREGGPPASTGSSAPPADAGHGPPGRPPLILVVEDEAPLRMLQERILQRLDVEVRLASSVAEAWPILETEEVDLIVSDVKMPGESGLDLYHRVGERRPELAGRFLFVTGDVGDPAIARFSTERPGMFLHKPFEVGEYLAHVTAALRPGWSA